jgi:hypothetical protein
MSLKSSCEKLGNASLVDELMTDSEVVWDGDEEDGSEVVKDGEEENVSVVTEEEKSCEVGNDEGGKIIPSQACNKGKKIKIKII